MMISLRKTDCKEAKRDFAISSGGVEAFYDSITLDVAAGSNSSIA